MSCAGRALWSIGLVSASGASVQIVGRSDLIGSLWFFTQGSLMDRVVDLVGYGDW